jgi:hypothetical protein
MFWSVWQQRQQSRPKLAARTALSFPVGPRLPVKGFVNVEIANVGPVPVRATGMVLLVQGIRETLAVMNLLWQSPAELPLVLEPGSGHWQAFVDPDVVRSSLNARYGPRKHWKIRARIGIAGEAKFVSFAGRRRWWRPWRTKWTTI